MSRSLWGNPRTFAQYDMKSRTIDLYVASEGTPENAVIDPFKLSREAATELLDSLIAAGVRPSNGLGEPAHVKALEGHISDLRAIAFKVLKVDK